MTTRSNIPGPENEARNVDKIYLIGNNILENYLQLPQWKRPVDGVTGWVTGVNVTDNVNAPVWCAFDRLPGTPTRPTSDAQNRMEVSLIFDLQQGTTGKYVFDTFIIAGHNFDAWSVGGGNDTDVYIDLAASNSDSDFTGTLYGARWTFSALTAAQRSKRLILHEAGTPGTGIFCRFADARYVRVRIVRTGTSFGTNVPEICEVWIGRRRQLGVFPDEPVDFKPVDTEASEFSPDSGQHISYIKNSGATNLEFTVAAGATVHGIDQNAEIEAWHEESDFGKHSIVTTFGSTDAAARPHFMVTPKNLRLPYTRSLERQTTLSFKEISPYVRSEL